MVIIVIIFMIPLILIIFPTVKNDNYHRNLLNDISKETGIKDILYVTKDNNYYIIKTTDKISVFDLNYKEVYTVNTKEIVSSSLELTYRRNNLYYKEKIREDKKLLYNFYDVKTNELVYKTLIGGTYEWIRNDLKRKAYSFTPLPI